MNHDAGRDTARVAVIVVHGVADQVAGTTARSVVELLVAGTPGRITDPPTPVNGPGTTYEAVDTHDFTLNVSPLQPTHRPERTTEPTPTGDTRPMAKAFAQSFTSDLHRANWEVPAKSGAPAVPGAVAAAAAARRPSASDGAAADEPDRGLQVTNFLLTKFVDNGAATEAYASSVVTLKRTSAASGSPQRIDVYEMYWADLSRLSGAIPRVITELFTLLFRLSKLGRGTVDEALGRMKTARGSTPSSWRGLALLQRSLDWAFVNVLAQLFAQLGLLALLIVAFALAAPHEDACRWVVGIGLGIVAVLWSAYRRRDGARRLAVPVALAGVAAVLLFVPSSAPWLLPLLWLALLTLPLDAALRVSEDRFPLTRASGLTLWVLCVATTVGAVVWFVTRENAPLSLIVWVQAALFSVELVLTGIKWWWIVASAIFVAWFGFGVAASRGRGYEASASVDTGRLGLFASLGAFIALTMATWALASGVLNAAVVSGEIRYTPHIFSVQENLRGISEAAARAAAFPHHVAAAASQVQPCACVAPPAARDRFGADYFLSFRYEDSTAYFSVIAALLLLLASYLAAMFLPSVLAELKLLRPKASARPQDSAAETYRLGRWLTSGFRHLGDAVSGVVLVSIAGVVAVAAVLFYEPAGGAGFMSRAIDGMAYASQVLLKPLVLGAAGIAAALSAFGGVLSRYVPGLRAPLDIALDVDNHFREFPRKSIPRARIFSRYAALLEHVSTQGYDRIVIVAHSQGTVISAELLRFLSDAPPGSPRDSHDRRAQLRSRLGCDVRLLTLGCPLRQLYAARFPSLYAWVLSEHGAGNGPASSDIGVQRWANAFTSGDYVGRWLWSSPNADGDPLGHPMADTVRPAILGREDAYSPFKPMPPGAHPLAASSELEVCLGIGAHTHYFEPDQTIVAWLIDHLVAD